MKKIITLSFVCMLFVGIGQVQAQTAENPWGFKLGLGLAGVDAVNNNMLGYAHDNVVGTVGLSYYISTHLGIALEANFFTMSNHHQASIKPSIQYYKTSNANINLLLRIKPFDVRLNPYIAVGIGGNFMSDRANVNTAQYATNFVFSVPFGIGFNYKITKQTSFNVQVLYNWTFTDDIIDTYPASPAILRSGASHGNIGGQKNDKFLLTTVGIVFNFGGGKSNNMGKQAMLLRQSVEKLDNIGNNVNEINRKMNHLIDLNEQTLDAIQQLQQAQNMSDNMANELREQFVHIVNNIQFAFDESYLLSTSKTELNSLANIMNHYPGLRLDIAGHADRRGSKSYNEALSKRRVQTVKEYLMSHGVSASHITTNAYGETNDLIHPSTSQADMPTVYAQNRAVQLTLSYQGM